MNSLNKTSSDARRPIDAAELDQLLSELSHEVPAHFADRIERSVRQTQNALHRQQLNHASPSMPLRQWLMVIAGGLIGVSQLAWFTLGLWLSAAAG